MGLTNDSLLFMKYLYNKHNFGNTLTLGRQSLNPNLLNFRDIMQFDINKINEYKNDEYCENLLKKEFKATKVDSIDFSIYENSTYQQNLNNPLNPNLDIKESYNTIFDIGTLEHLYNIPQAILNLINLSKIGGRIIHVLPSNNQNGHGFWQFSPELFFEIYNLKNGFELTEIYLVEIHNWRNIYKVLKPKQGKRINLTGFKSKELQILVATRKTAQTNRIDITQEAYINLWKNNKTVISGSEVKIKFFNSENKFLFLLKDLYKFFIYKNIITWRIGYAISKFFIFAKYKKYYGKHKLLKKINIKYFLEK